MEEYFGRLLQFESQQGLILSCYKIFPKNTKATPFVGAKSALSY
jgi:hypothetical protein